MRCCPQGDTKCRPRGLRRCPVHGHVCEVNSSSMTMTFSPNFRPCAFRGHDTDRPSLYAKVAKTNVSARFFTSRCVQHVRLADRYCKTRRNGNREMQVVMARVIAFHQRARRIFHCFAIGICNLSVRRGLIRVVTPLRRKKLLPERGGPGDFKRAAAAAAYLNRLELPDLVLHALGLTAEGLADRPPGPPVSPTNPYSASYKGSRHEFDCPVR